MNKKRETIAAVVGPLRLRAERSQGRQAPKAAGATASAALTAALLRSSASGPCEAALKAETATETSAQGMAAKRYWKATAPPMASARHRAGGHFG